MHKTITSFAFAVAAFVSSPAFADGFCVQAFYGRGVCYPTLSACQDAARLVDGACFIDRQTYPQPSPRVTPDLVAPDIAGNFARGVAEGRQRQAYSVAPPPVYDKPPELQPPTPQAGPHTIISQAFRALDQMDIRRPNPGGTLTAERIEACEPVRIAINEQKRARREAGREPLTMADEMPYFGCLHPSH